MHIQYGGRQVINGCIIYVRVDVYSIYISMHVNIMLYIIKRQAYVIVETTWLASPILN